MRNAEWGIIIFLIGLTCNASAAIYKWTNEKGNTVYSDTPQKGAKEVELSPSQSLTWEPKKEAAPVKEEKAGTSPTKPSYEKFELSEPTSKQFIRNNEGIVPIQVSLEPDLKQGDKIQPILDGKPYGNPQSSASFSIRDVERGEHTLKLQLQDEKGNVLLESGTTTFFLQRQIITSPTSPSSPGSPGAAPSGSP